MSWPALTAAGDVHPSLITTQEKFVLVILAQYANTDQEAYPSIESLMFKTAQGRRQLFRHLESLQSKGFIARLPGRGRESTRYKVFPDRKLEPDAKNDQWVTINSKDPVVSPATLVSDTTPLCSVAGDTYEVSNTTRQCSVARDTRIKDKNNKSRKTGREGFRPLPSRDEWFDLERFRPLARDLEFPDRYVFFLADEFEEHWRNTNQTRKDWALAFQKWMRKDFGMHPGRAQRFVKIKPVVRETLSIFDTPDRVAPPLPEIARVV